MGYITYEEFYKRTGIKVTVKHNGKMEGMSSLSTDCSSNKYCLERMKNGHSVCKKCYADRMMSRYKNLQKMTKLNMDSLKELLDVSDLPTINSLYFRFEAFGDLDNEIQFINYVHICEKNPKTNFALWTKNPWIIDNVFKLGVKKPKNLNIILSSVELNKPTESKYDFVDKVFTVYDKDYIMDNDVKINCGGRKCMSCLKCYKKTNRTYYINEKIK